MDVIRVKLTGMLHIWTPVPQIMKYHCLFVSLLSHFLLIHFSRLHLLLPTICIPSHFIPVALVVSNVIHIRQSWACCYNRTLTHFGCCKDIWIMTHVLRFVNKYCHDVTVDDMHTLCMRDDVIKWKHFPRYWPFVRGIHRSQVDSPRKIQWREALLFCSFCAWTNGWETPVICDAIVLIMASQ